MTKRNRIASSLFAALRIVSALACLYLVRAFVTAIWGNVAGIVFVAILLVLLIWWLYYETDDKDEKQEEAVYTYKKVIVKKDLDADDIVYAYEDGWEYVDEYEIDGTLIIIFRYKQEVG